MCWDSEGKGNTRLMLCYLYLAFYYIPYFFKKKPTNCTNYNTVNRSHQTRHQMPTPVDVCVHSQGSINSCVCVTGSAHHFVVVVLDLCEHVLGDL
jgi:hypothetical protein